MKHLTSPFPSSYDEEDETFGQTVKLHSFSLPSAPAKTILVT